MDRWLWLFTTALVLAAGCRSNSNQELLEREMRWQEDKIYHLEEHLRQYEAELETYKQRSADRETSGTTSPARSGILRPMPSRDSAVTPPSVSPPASVAPPTIELPSARPPTPYQGPPSISPPDASVPDGEPPSFGVPSDRSVPPTLPPRDLPPPSEPPLIEPQREFPPGFGASRSSSSGMTPTGQRPAAGGERSGGSRSSTDGMTQQVWPPSNSDEPAPAAFSPRSSVADPESRGATVGAAPPSNGRAILPRSAEIPADDPPVAAEEEVTPPPGYVTAGDRDVVELVIDSERTRGWDSDARVGHEGIELVIEPRNLAGQVVDEAGAIAIVAVDPLLDGRASRLARWDVPADVAAQHFVRGGGIAGMYFKLRWPERLPQHRTLIVFVRYTGRDGRQLISEQQVDVDIVTQGNAAWAQSTPRNDERGSAARTATRPTEVRSASAASSAASRSPSVEAWKASATPIEPPQPREPPRLFPMFDDGEASAASAAGIAEHIVKPIDEAGAASLSQGDAVAAEPAPPSAVSAAEAPAAKADASDKPAAATAPLVKRSKPQWAPYR